MNGVKYCYCAYCAYLSHGDCYYCSAHERVIPDSMVKKPNGCECFAESDLGHVDTGKKYQPREKKEQPNDLRQRLFEV